MLIKSPAHLSGGLAIHGPAVRGGPGVWQSGSPVVRQSGGPAVQVSGGPMPDMLTSSTLQLNETAYEAK